MKKLVLSALVLIATSCSKDDLKSCWVCTQGDKQTTVCGTEAQAQAKFLTTPTGDSATDSNTFNFHCKKK
jgi:hypothetical protein